MPGAWYSINNSYYSQKYILALISHNVFRYSSNETQAIPATLPTSPA